MEKMCKTVKNRMPKKNPKAYAKLVKDCTDYCMKCGVASNESARLCKGVKLKEALKKDSLRR